MKITITGPTGCGKSMIARAIQLMLSKRFGRTSSLKGEKIVTITTEDKSCKCQESR